MNRQTNNVVTIQRNAIKGLINYKIIVLAMFALLLIIATWLLTYASHATSGSELEDYEVEKRKLINENSKMTLEIAKATSLPNIEQSAKNLGMIKNDSGNTIRIR